MKQHITISQLNKLSEKGKVKLIKWFDPKNLSVKYRGILPGTLSIGEMIEILDENKKHIFIVTGAKSDGWSLSLIDNLPIDIVNEQIINKKELCDALWKAVKKVLDNGE